MVNDDQNRLTGTENRRDGDGRRDYRNNCRSGCIRALITWAPWSSPRVAENTTPGTTTGSTRPSAPTAPKYCSGSHRSGRTFHHAITKKPLEAKDF